MATDTPTNRFWAFIEHPRTALIGALVTAGLGVLAPAFWILAVILVIRSAWEWAPIRGRIPFDFQSPVIRRNRVPKIKAAPAELGRLDFELYLKQTSEASVHSLGKISKEMERNAARTRKETVRVERVKDKSVEQRHRALAHGGRVMHKHAQRLSRLENRYRIQVGEMLSNARGIVETSGPNDSDVIGASTQGWRNSVVENRQATVGYQDTVRGTRALGVSQSINGACDELVLVLDRVIEDADTVLAYCDWVATTITARIRP